MEEDLVVALLGLEDARGRPNALEPEDALSVTHGDRQGRDENNNPDTEDGSEIEFTPRT